MDAALVESDAVVLKARRLMFLPMPTDQAITGGNPEHAPNARQLGEELFRDRPDDLGRADEVDLGDRRVGASIVVFAGGDSRMLRGDFEDRPYRLFGRFGIDGDDHERPFPALAAGIEPTATAEALCSQ